MNSDTIWQSLQETFDNQKIFWLPEERDSGPGVMDRLLHYLISYYESPAVARKSVRVFCGVDPINGLIAFSGWNEVRVSTVREISDALVFCGAKGEVWELAVTIKDFLCNTWNTLDTLNLDEIPEKCDAYINQLRAVPHSWTINIDTDKKGKTRTLETPLRHSHCSFYKAFKRQRSLTEPVLPDCVIDYLRYSWKLTAVPPFENHTNRIMSRIGLFESNTSLEIKLAVLAKFLGENKRISKHKRLVQLGKMVCFNEDPRCEVCPLQKSCSKKDI
jgi:hypothetical protein